MTGRGNFDPPARALLAPWRDALRDSDLSTTTKAVGWTIATYADRDGKAYPSKALIASGASLKVATRHARSCPARSKDARDAGATCDCGKNRVGSARAVDGAIEKLADAGFVEVSTSGGRSSNLYTLTVPTPRGDAGLEHRAGTRGQNGNTAADDAQPRTEHVPTPRGDAGESSESEESGARATAAWQPRAAWINTSGRGYAASRQDFHDEAKKEPGYEPEAAEALRLELLASIGEAA